MKRKMIIIVAIMTALIFVFATCKSKPETTTPTPKEIMKAQSEANVDTKPLPSTILDWSNRNLGEASVPGWLKPLMQGNTQPVRQAYSINPSARVKPIQAQRANRDEARVLAGLLFNQQIANELKTLVVTAAAQTLNLGQMDIIEEITTATKINITGNNRVTDFWQYVETTDNSGAKTRDYLYYIVWSMDAVIWDQLVRKYVNDVIGQIPDRQVQTNVANAYEDIAAASRRENVLDDREFQQMVEGMYQTAKNAHDIEMAQINAGAQVGSAQARADGLARYGAYRSGDPVVAAIASATAADYDWISALRTASKVLD